MSNIRLFNDYNLTHFKYTENTCISIKFSLKLHIFLYFNNLTTLCRVAHYEFRVKMSTNVKWHWRFFLTAVIFFYVRLSFPIGWFFVNFFLKIVIHREILQIIIQNMCEIPCSNRFCVETCSNFYISCCLNRRKLKYWKSAEWSVKKVSKQLLVAL